MYHTSKQERNLIEDGCFTTSHENQATGRIQIKVLTTRHYCFLTLWCPVENLKGPIGRDIDLILSINYSTNIIQEIFAIRSKTKCNVESTFIATFLKI